MKQRMNPDVYGLDKRVRCPICGQMGWKFKKGIMSHFGRKPTVKVDIWGREYIEDEPVLISECGID